MRLAGFYRTLACWLLLGLQTSSCGEDVRTGLDITLAPDININSTDFLLQQIGTLVVIVDSAEGLYSPGEERVDGNLRISDVDSDGQLELSATVDAPRDLLPVIRLERGGLKDVPLDIRVHGVSRSTPGLVVAAGSVAGARFEDGEIIVQPVPFNVKPAHLPPRVVELFPRDTETLEACDVTSVVVIFSKSVNTSTVNPRTVSVENATLHDIKYRPGVAEIVIGEIPVGSYQVQIGSGVQDLEGRALDQVPAQAQAQAFSSQFSTIDDRGCGATARKWCWLVPGHQLPPGAQLPELNPEDAECPGPPDRLTCDFGVCVPATCTGVRCPTSFVCNDATGACELDCRLYGALEACDGVAGACQAATGVCSG